MGPKMLVLSLSVISLICPSTMGAAPKIVMQPFETRNNQMVGQIGMGTPTQAMHMIVDTESTDFFLVEYKCKEKGRCKTSRNGYQKEKSSTYYNLLFPFATNYGGETSRGRYVTDKLTALETGSAPRIPFPLVTQPSKFLIDSNVDGVFGVGFAKEKTLVPSIFQLLTFALGQPVYTFRIEKFEFKNNQLTDSGNIAYGGNYKEKCENHFEYFPLAKPNRFALPLLLGMDGWITSEGSVLIRSGQQRLEGPQKRVQIYLKRVGATFDPKLGQHTVPCANLKKIPALELHFGGKKAVLKPVDYTVPVAEQPQTCVVLIGEREPKEGEPEWVIGNLLMRNWCLQLDMKKKRLGLARPKL